MPKIVDSDTLNTSLSRSPIHFPVKVVLRNGEYPFIRFNAIQAFEIILLRKIFYPAESPAAYRCSFLNLRLTYEASHPIACDGCYHARTVAGGEYSALCCRRRLRELPGLLGADCKSSDLAHRSSRSYREVVIRRSFIRLSSCQRTVQD